MILLLGLIILGLPLLGYDFKLLVIGLLVFFLSFPEQREKILGSSLIRGLQKKIIESGKDMASQPNLVLAGEGDIIINKLGLLKFNNRRIKGQLVSINKCWKNFKKLIKTVLDQKSSLPYPHHHFETLKDLRKNLLNQISSLIVGSSPDVIRERTLLKDRTLPRDEKIRTLLRKMNFVLDQLMVILEKNINQEWKQNPYTEINPVHWSAPQAYDKDDQETFL